MDRQERTPGRCLVKKTDRKVRFCDMCTEFKCKFCDKNFDPKKPHETTTFHQIEKDLTRVDTKKAKMIVDLGCPNSVLGTCDVETFINCLSHYQQKHLEMIDVDENYKFGPSGPYKCTRKMRFPIGSDEEVFWVTVAVVDAKIPMLLGNNIMKPLEADIKLFSTGGGLLTLDEEEIALEETGAGHYTIKVRDLGKLCRTRQVSPCKVCDLEFESRRDLETHLKTEHESNEDILILDLNCKVCEKRFKSRTGLSIHMKTKHGILQDEKISYLNYECKNCDGAFRSKSGLNNHIQTNHKKKKQEPLKSALKKNVKSPKNKHEEILRDIEGELTEEKVIKDLNTMMNSNPTEKEKKVIKTMRDIASLKISCLNYPKLHSSESKVISHEGLKHTQIEEQHINETESIFLSHHVEEYDDCEVELDGKVWDVFHSDDDDAIELTEDKRNYINTLPTEMQRNYGIIFSVQQEGSKG